MNSPLPRALRNFLALHSLRYRKRRWRWENPPRSYVIYRRKPNGQETLLLDVDRHNISTQTVITRLTELLELLDEEA